jgi:hypothetical protein
MTTRSWARCVSIAAVAYVMLMGVRPAAAGEVTIDRGFLDVSSNRGRMAIAGTRGFTFVGGVGDGIFMPQDCNLDPLHCTPGHQLSLRAHWDGSDLPGSATLDGVIYPKVGTDPVNFLVDFTGFVTLPPLTAQPTTVTARFEFTGNFTHPEPELVLGTGTATVYLQAQPFFPGSWFISRVVYDFGGALPPPWKSTDVGNVGRFGTAFFANGAFTVAGSGADIWGTVDSFQFVNRPLAGNGQVVARVTSQLSQHVFSKAGVMIRESLSPSSAQVILDVKPGGGLEFMTRPATGAATMFIAGGVAPPQPWLRLARSGNVFTGSVSANGRDWTTVGFATVPMAESTVTGLAVTSHDVIRINVSVFDNVAVTPSTPPTNLLVGGDFEMYKPWALGPPGWVSDFPFRQVPAKSETYQPHAGAQNGACWSPQFLDCGMYQELRAPQTATYRLTFYATADRPGGLVGANVNQVLAATTNVQPRGFRNYGAQYSTTFTARAGDLIRVWMYSPATPGYVVIDDVRLTIVQGSTP